MSNDEAALRGLESILEAIHAIIASLEAQLAPPPPPSSLLARLRRLLIGQSAAEQFRRGVCAMLRHSLGLIAKGLKACVLADLRAPERVGGSTAFRDDDGSGRADLDAAGCDEDGFDPSAVSRPVAEEDGAGDDGFPTLGFQVPSVPEAELARPAFCGERAAWRAPVFDAETAGAAAWQWTGVDPSRKVYARCHGSMGRPTCDDAVGATAPRIFAATPRRKLSFGDAFAWFGTAPRLPPIRARWGEARGPDNPRSASFRGGGPIGRSTPNLLL